MTDPTSFEPAGDATAPERDRPDRDHADGARVIARHSDPSVSRPLPSAEHAETYVDWVRPTDVAARVGARVLEKTADVNQDVHELLRQASRDGAVRIRRALSRREAELVPDVPPSPAQPALGRQGVSR